MKPDLDQRRSSQLLSWRRLPWRSPTFWGIAVIVALGVDLTLFTFCAFPGHSCPDADGIYPPEVLRLPDHPDIPSDYSAQYATGINGQGWIVGMAESLEGEDGPKRAFLVSRDGGEFHWLNPEPGPFFPSGISESGLIVGTCFSSPQSSFGGRPPPERFGNGRACAVHANSPESFMDLHPPELLASRATHISSGGRIGGLCYSQAPEETVKGYPDAYYQACLFDGQGGVVRIFQPGFERSLLTALSDDWAAVRLIPTEDQAGGVRVFSISDTTLILSPELPGEIAAIEDINVSGKAVGSYFDNQTLTAGIFTLDLPVTNVVILDDLQLPPGAVLRSVQGVRLNDAGIIAFTGSVDGPTPGKSKPYALRIGTAGLIDMTPPGLDGYGDARDIGPDGTVVGYTALQAGGCLLLNRAFARRFSP